ncbi:alpha/beta hydrolase [Clostridium sp. SHJSY1]|uniref:alpha/beta hydrolase n=1 Tax=Clostridium sp. SHJSY1 TaxID=2942483 RepID=UPI0028750F5E|nr:alpha/beta hydrolase [Clostridium sp. SHJSY1]MDS0526430.1 alpha/beta hydrolase [Clostridium sp. SHJSY1]
MKKGNLNFKKNRKLRKFVLCVIGIFLVLCAGILLWMSKSYKYEGVAAAALKSNDVIKVNDDNYITFTPQNETSTKGLIFYPGAKVEPEAYSPMCKKIAEAGYKVIIVKMPLNFAIFSPDEAKKVIDLYPEIDKWAIGGHSLGGVMASNYAAKDEKIKGLVLYASYPQGQELEEADKQVLSIWGSKDGVADIDKIKDAKLPKDTEFIEIDGGNHAQFGDYGEQSGDNEATISEEEQINTAVKETIKMLDKL